LHPNSVLAHLDSRIPHLLDLIVAIEYKMLQSSQKKRTGQPDPCEVKELTLQRTRARALEVCVTSSLCVKTVKQRHPLFHERVLNRASEEQITSPYVEQKSNFPVLEVACKVPSQEVRRLYQYLLHEKTTDPFFETVVGEVSYDGLDLRAERRRLYHELQAILLCDSDGADPAERKFSRPSETCTLVVYGASPYFLIKLPTGMFPAGLSPENVGRAQKYLDGLARAEAVFLFKEKVRDILRESPAVKESLCSLDEQGRAALFRLCRGVLAAERPDAALFLQQLPAGFKFWAPLQHMHEDVFVTRCSVVRKTNMLGFQFERRVPMLRVEVSHPSIVRALCDALLRPPAATAAAECLRRAGAQSQATGGSGADGAQNESLVPPTFSWADMFAANTKTKGGAPPELFNCNDEFGFQVMVENMWTGEGWLRLASQGYTVNTILDRLDDALNLRKAVFAASKEEQGPEIDDDFLVYRQNPILLRQKLARVLGKAAGAKKNSLSSVYVECNIRHVRSLSEKQDLVPHKILAFDIEAIPKEAGSFPKAQAGDPVTHVACITDLVMVPEDTPAVEHCCTRVIFGLDTHANTTTAADYQHVMAHYPVVKPLLFTYEAAVYTVCSFLTFAACGEDVEKGLPVSWLKTASAVKKVLLATDVFFYERVCKSGELRDADDFAQRVAGALGSLARCRALYNQTSGAAVVGACENLLLNASDWCSHHHLQPSSYEGEEGRGSLFPDAGGDDDAAGVQQLLNSARQGCGQGERAYVRFFFPTGLYLAHMEGVREHCRRGQEATLCAMDFLELLLTELALSFGAAVDGPSDLVSNLSLIALPAGSSVHARASDRQRGCMGNKISFHVPVASSTLDRGEVSSDRLAVSFRDRSAAFSLARDLAEAQLLYDLADFFRRSGAQSFVAHNGDGFDIPFLLRRGSLLRVPSAWIWTHNPLPMSVKEKVFRSKAQGALKITNILMPGGSSLDTMRFIRLNYKLSSYSLSSVCNEFLNGMSKDEMHYDDIRPLFEESSSARTKVALYCLRDVQLLIELQQTLNISVRLAEQERATGVMPEDLIQKGQTVRSMSKILRAAVLQNYVKPFQDKDVRGTGVFQGATVIEPCRGYYTDPVVTLDFASLYPSIMRAWNICYTTLVDRPRTNLPKICAWLRTTRKFAKKEAETGRAWFERHFFSAGTRGRGEEMVEATLRSIDRRTGVPAHVYTPSSGGPAQHSFSSPATSKDAVYYWLRPEVVPGLIPQELEKLNALRSHAKKMKSQAKGFEKSVWDSRQLELKLVSNSMYGCPSGYGLYMQAVSALVTTKGRFLIDYSMSRAPGICKQFFPAIHAHVIYGDTDSIMVKLSGTKDLREATVVALRLEKELNALYKHELGLSCISIEWETLYMSFYLIMKKRYSAIKYEPSGPEREDGSCELVCKGTMSKGMENVRRDQIRVTRRDMDANIRVLAEQGVAQATRFVRHRAHALVSGQVPLEDVILSQGYAKEQYADPKPAHIQLADRIGLQPGNRVSYYYTIAPPDSKQESKIEHPSNFGILTPVDFKETLKRKFEEPFAKMMTVALTQEINEIGPRFKNAEETEKHLKKRQKKAIQILYEDISCEICHKQLSIESIVPLHFKNQAAWHTVREQHDRARAALGDAGLALAWRKRLGLLSAEEARTLFLQKRAAGITSEPGGAPTTKTRQAKQISLFDSWRAKNKAASPVSRASCATKTDLHPPPREKVLPTSVSTAQEQTAVLEQFDRLAGGGITFLQNQVGAVEAWKVSACKPCVWRFHLTHHAHPTVNSAYRERVARAALKHIAKIMDNDAYFVKGGIQGVDRRTLHASRKSSILQFQKNSDASQTLRSACVFCRQRLDFSPEPGTLPLPPAVCQSARCAELAAFCRLAMPQQLRLAQEKNAVFWANCARCRSGTGLDPLSCKTYECEQFFKRMEAQRHVKHIETLLKLL
jgi:DNA polymerase elongation subunit (family B)